MHKDKCPECGISWYQEQTIYEFFLKTKTPEEARKTAELYGCTEEKPKHFSQNVIGVEIQGKYDGVSFWKCTACESIFNRWNMKKVENYD